MTRLNRSHIRATRDHLAHVDEMLQVRVNADLRGVALRTIGVKEETAVLSSSRRVAVVPITMGEGVIVGFSQALCAIAGHVGLDAGVTSGADVSGIAEAYADGSDIVVLADDDRFVAINTKTGLIADNDRTTGEGFAMLLAMMAGGVRGCSCGVIGCGPVGTHAALRLARMGAKVMVCDLDDDRSRRLVARMREEHDAEAVRANGVAALLAKCAFIVDATPAVGIVSADAIRADTVITAPGVPVGLTPAALERIGARFYHDNLPLGVATMLLAAVYGKMTAPARDSET